jgi:hypothetical protein
MKNGFAILITLLFLLADMYSFAQRITYSGPVEFEMEIIKSADGGGKDENYNWGVSVDEKRIIKATFYVTFYAGPGIPATGTGMYQLTDIQENVQLIASAKNYGFEEKISQTCAGEENKPKDSWGKSNTRTVSPGDSETLDFSAVTTRKDPSEQVIQHGLIGIQGDKYSLILQGKMKVSVASTSHNTTTFPCLKSNPPSEPLTTTTELEWPIAIGSVGQLTNPDYLEGFHVAEDISSDDCRHCIGSLSNMVHGEVSCSYTSKVTTTWMLTKRTDECNAEVTYLNGDVKINGVPAKEGSIKVGAGDIIETGEKSRISISINNKNELYNLGSKSKLQLNDPCKPNRMNPPGKGLSSVKFLVGKLFSQRHPGSYSRNDFESDEEWQRFQTRHSSWFRYGGAGVRGEMFKAPKVYFASANLNLNSLFFVPPDSEKEELIPALNSIPKNASAFYIHCENGEVKNFTVVKGTLKIEDSVQLKNKIVSEGTTINTWDDGSKMTDVIVFSQ